MYAWASREYMLDHMTWLEILMYYEKGIEFEETKAKILLSTFGRAMSGTNETESKADEEDQTFDRAAFYARYGHMMKRA